MSDPEKKTSEEGAARPLLIIGRVVGALLVAVVAMLYFFGAGGVTSGMYGGSMGSLDMLLDLMGLVLILGVALVVLMVYKLTGRLRNTSSIDNRSD